jgi:aerobic-type carbon monoxide dehydrogenase small subunit (CoxS/CutS family)
MGKTKKKKRMTFTRREFLKGMGGGALGATVTPYLLGQERTAGEQAAVPIEVFARMPVTLKVNGKAYALEVAPNETLLHVLRERLGLTGTKRICDRGECGGCTVLLDGRPVYSCLYLAFRADGREVMTVEGLASGEKLHPVQKAFIEKDGYQCGFCTPGFLMSSAALLNKTNSPSLDEIKASLSGNICRCGNYAKIYEAVAAASKFMRKA